ncbi:hypothetical protein ZWY2020_020945 [Hordeum vulgare]|nr:hypothetical protein ZWY2020_020945 [Hordeum vulgare]
MAGVPPPHQVRGGATGGPRSHAAPIMGTATNPSRPPTQTPGYSGQQGPAPVYSYGGIGNQIPGYGQAGQYTLSYGQAVVGGPSPMYGALPTGMSAPTQFHLGGVVAQPGQKRKKKKKPQQQQFDQFGGALHPCALPPPQHIPVQHQFPQQHIPQPHVQTYEQGQYQQFGQPQPHVPTTVDASPLVVPVSGVQVDPMPKTKAKKWFRCWKCAVDTHASKDCSMQHFRYICDKLGHPTLRCSVLKLPKPNAFVSGVGAEETYFAQLPDSVVKDYLAPTRTPIAHVQVNDLMVPAAVVESQVARRCPVHDQWKWEAIQHLSDAYLVSFPSLEDLYKVDGIQMNVPSVNAQMTVTAWRSQEVPHKIELDQIWLHVDGVPHTVRHFLGLWAVGTLMGKTLDVDLISLRRRGVVHIIVAMTNTQILAKDKDDAGPFVATDVVVKLKGYAFTFRREPTGYTLDPYFVPFIWRRKSDDADDDSGAKEKDDEMDTSEHTGNPAINSFSSSVPAKIIQVPHVQ